MHIGLLFQTENLLEHLTVDQNLAVAQRLAGRPSRSRSRQRRTELLDSLGVLGRRNAYPAELSGGEAVRAGLAVALVNDPAVLLADEPTGEVDSVAERRILDLLRARTDALC